MSRLAPSPPWQILITTILTTRQGTGCKSHTFFLQCVCLIPRFNDALRHAERRLVLDVEGIRRLAAQSVGRNPADVVDISKLAEGGFNLTFLITLRDNFRMVTRIPYPATVPKYYAVASEVATMEFLRSSGLHVPQVYGYSPASDNMAKTEYIFMEYIRGTKLSDVGWSWGNRILFQSCVNLFNSSLD